MECATDVRVHQGAAEGEGARAVGMRAVWFQTTEQALAEVEAILAGDGPPEPDAGPADTAETGA